MCGAIIGGLIVGAAVGVGGGLLSGYYSGKAAQSAANAQIAEMRKLNNKLISEMKYDARISKRLTVAQARSRLREIQKRSSINWALSVRDKVGLERKLLQMTRSLDASKRNSYFVPKASLEDVNLGNKIESMFI